MPKVDDESTEGSPRLMEVVGYLARSSTLTAVCSRAAPDAFRILSCLASYQVVQLSTSGGKRAEGHQKHKHRAIFDSDNDPREACSDAIAHKTSSSPQHSTIRDTVDYRMSAYPDIHTSHAENLPLKQVRASNVSRQTLNSIRHLQSFPTLAVAYRDEFGEAFSASK